MQMQYEYKIFELAGKAKVDEDALNAWGAVGWSISGLSFHPVGSCVLILQRQIIPPTSSNLNLG
jgi:hypothetical protein